MKPSLLILAAGLGSRYGSLKQIEHYGPSGETITDYSIYDALRSGFGRILFVISPSMEQEFKESYCQKFPTGLEIDYVTQGIEDIPSTFTINPDRKKPWGTAHAILMASDKITGPFAVINADDFYGKEAFEIIASWLIQPKNQPYLEICLAGYPIINTLSKHGTVSRGVCSIDKDGFLTNITERTKIREINGKIVFFDDDDKAWELNKNSLVSMNLFGFTASIFKYLNEHFNKFISENFNNPKTELYIPAVVDRLIQDGLARVKVIKTDASWFGVTYKEDRPLVIKMINNLIRMGIYPSDLWK